MPIACGVPAGRAKKRTMKQERIRRARLWATRTACNYGRGFVASTSNRGCATPRASRPLGCEHAHRIGVVDAMVFAADRDTHAVVSRGSREQGPDAVGVSRVGEGAREEIFQLVAQFISSHARLRQAGLVEQLLQLGER